MAGENEKFNGCPLRTMHLLPPTCVPTKGGGGGGKEEGEKIKNLEKASSMDRKSSPNLDRVPPILQDRD